MSENEIEKEFYKKFEIAPAKVDEYIGASYFWDTVEIDGKRYIPIDDSMLLKIIVELSKVNSVGFEDFTDVEELKNFILDTCNYNAYRKRFKKKIQKMLKGHTYDSKNN